MRSALLALALAFAGCGGGGPAPAAPQPRQKVLYDRIGGMDAIKAIVDELVTIIVADARINAMFANADLAGFKSKLADQLCQATGGPCTYTGKGMKEAHVAMNIKPADFDAFIDDFVQALRKFGVDEQEQQELRALLAPMQQDIVQAQ